jgi:hypothetical protein
MTSPSIERGKQRMLEAARVFIREVGETCPESPRVKVAAMAVMLVYEAFRPEGIAPSTIMAEFAKAAERRKAN